MVKTTKLNLPQRPRRLRRYPSLCCAGMLACLAAVAGFAAKPAAVPPRNSIGRDLADRQGDGEKEELSMAGGDDLRRVDHSGKEATVG